MGFWADFWNGLFGSNDKDNQARLERRRQDSLALQRSDAARLEEARRARLLERQARLSELRATAPRPLPIKRIDPVRPMPSLVGRPKTIPIKHITTRKLK